MKHLRKFVSASDANEKVVDKKTTILYDNTKILLVNGIDDCVLRFNGEKIIAIEPSLEITTESGFDTASIPLSYTSDGLIKGTVNWACNLGSEYVKIEGSNLVFLKHYEGTITLTALSNNCSVSKDVTITCKNELVNTTYAFGSFGTQDAVDADSTGVTISYTIVPTYTYHNGSTTVGNPIAKTQFVTFTTNDTNSETTKNGSFVSEEGVTVNWSLRQKGKENVGYEYVNLGLPSGTLWAKCNVGATSESDFGMFFQWGDTNGANEPNSGSLSKVYNWSTYFDGENGTKFTHYKKDGITSLRTSDDMVNAVMGDNWLTPSKADFEELLANTNKTANVTINGVKGTKFTSKTDSSKYIFIPYAGYCDYSSRYGVGYDAYLWSSSLNEYYSDSAWNLYLHDYGNAGMDYYYRYDGFSVRGVLKNLPKPSSYQNHDGVTATIILDGGKNNVIGDANVYEHLQTLYVNGEVYDIDDLVITAGAGSGSGSGSGSGANAGGIAFDSTMIGAYAIELVMDEAYRNRPSDFINAKLLNLTVPEKHQLKANGYEYVDLGLKSGTLWAKCNVGATNQEDFGMFFQWGDTNGANEPNSGSLSKVYNWSTYFDTTNNGSTFNKYNNNGGLTTLDASDDAVIAKMGGDWHMPSKDQMKELFKQTDIEYNVTENNVKGHKFMNKSDHNKYIFIPYAGGCYSSSHINVGYNAYLWSSSLDEGNSNDAWDLYLYSSGYADMYLNSRYDGFSVRGVL